MPRLSGGLLPDPHPEYGAYPQPPLGAGHASTEYDPRPSAVGEARAEVRRQLEGWGLAERDDLDDLVATAELLVSELATNALVHSASRFRLTLSAAHGVLRCEVTDAGRRVPQVLQAGTSESGRVSVPEASGACGASSCQPVRERVTVESSSLASSIRKTLSPSGSSLRCRNAMKAAPSGPSRPVSVRTGPEHLHSSAHH